MKKVYVRVPPEVYVPLEDITAMYVEEFNLFLHYKQVKHFRILMKMNVQMDSGSLIVLYD